MSLNGKEGVFIIAELSANHAGKKEVALETVRAAADCGADAIKLQTYTPDTITLNSDKADFMIDQGTIWDGKKLYDLYQEAYTPWEWHEEIFNEARKCGLICFSSPFDKTAVDFLEQLNTPAYKIASFEITDTPLIAYAASKGKPMIMSTGVAELKDIELAVETCRNEGNDDITLLQCTSSYPAPIERANLMTIVDMAARFGLKVGLSDHSLDNVSAVVATTLGASLIEKHFILDKKLGGPDASFSLDPEQFKSLVNDVRRAEASIGQVSYDLDEKSKASRFFARSLYIAANMKKGDVLTEQNLRSVRPSKGLHPQHYHEVLGKRVNRDLEAGDALSFDHIMD